MLKLKRRTLSIDVYGELMEMKFPTAKEFYDMEEKKNGKNDFDLLVKFLTGLGASERLIMSLELSHLVDIMTALSGKSEAL